MWITSCFLLLGVVQGSERADPLVETKLGVIRGLHSNDGDYTMYLGIPYGKVDKGNPFGVKEVLLKKRENITEKGAAHGDEISYLFDMTYDLSPPTVEDQRIINTFTKLWTNFIKYGNPTPETTALLPLKWLPVTEQSRRYLNINSGLCVEKGIFKERVAFWKLFLKANKSELKGYNATAPFK